MVLPPGEADDTRFELLRSGVEKHFITTHVNPNHVPGTVRSASFRIEQAEAQTWQAALEIMVHKDLFSLLQVQPTCLFLTRCGVVIVFNYQSGLTHVDDRVASSCLRLYLTILTFLSITKPDPSRFLESEWKRAYSLLGSDSTALIREGNFCHTDS